MSLQGSTGLSKFLVLKGMQCPRALWLAQNPPDLEFPGDPAKQARFAAGTEVGVLKQFAKLFPDLSAALTARIANVRDLMLPFRNCAVYRWPMKGSYSIKQVLPAMVPELSYQGMAIADGTAAMRAYQEMCATQDAGRVAEMRRGLLEYCGMDTWGMVRILGELERLAGAELPTCNR